MGVRCGYTNRRLFSLLTFHFALARRFAPTTGLTNCSGYGGIVGYNYTYGGNTATVKNCIVAGATIPAYESLYGPTYGAVVGINEGTLQNNYYTACNVGGVANATEVGCSQYEGSYLEQSDPDGAKPALLDNVDNTDAIAAIDALSKNITYSVCINGRTLYKDGTWNTLCLPFDLRDFTGTLLEDAEVRRLDISSFGKTGFDETTSTLTLDFMKIDEGFAGNPFIVRWGTPEEPGGENIVNPVFPAVRVENVDITQRGYKIKQLVEFSGTFKPENIYPDLNYKLYLVADNKLY